IVDITNYVMEEYAQPMHAYDLDTIAGRKIVVKRAEEGETFQTLDGQDRELDSSVLMICDGEKSVGLAGIMGGENSKITDDVKTMLFEAACFDGTNIRLTGKKLGMRTDAQAKFEKGLDPNTAMEAMDRACQLIEELGAGEVVGGCVDEYPEKKEPTRVTYDVKKINDLLGIDVSEDQMCEYWNRVGLIPNKANKSVYIPTWRQDVLRLADLAEEVARFYGYDNIPTTLPSGEATQGGVSYETSIRNIARNVVEQFGFSEAMTYSFESPKVFDKLLVPEGSGLRNAIEISNPLGVDYSIMRTTPLNGMLTSLATNYNHRNKDVRLYELANVYLPKALPLTKLPEEKMMLTLGMYGEGDFFDMKGCVEGIFEKTGIREVITYEPKEERTWLHPGRRADILAGEDTIGFLGEIHPEVADNYEIGTKVYVAVLDIEILAKMASFDVKYKGVAKFPAVTRDISLVMKKSILAGQVEEVIRQSGGKLLEDYHLFDIYEGSNVGADEKSLAYSIRFRAKDRTLEDKDVTKVMDKILNKLESLGVVLRQ
ncbi:MAG: phenylalanine--tRNA ligase subunit beta, partial [Eubacterium sp.]|nr:phenylalanine--tRNA ligase subunit beta [Eubacterium sp.]